ncbi:hypothetical protein BC830DRAFT_1218646 [Chytriomyces sp. MP71]|nr:hypothetical protein BC830DRAFT_1218646 [Chytriomyces sp. MP71]
MRFVYTRDIARLCGGLARAQRSGMGEVFVRWDWRSCCETSSIGEDEDDEEVVVEDDNSFVSATSNEESFQPDDASSPQVPLQTDPRAPLPASLMHRRRSSFGLETSTTVAATPFPIASTDDPKTAYGDRYPDFLDDDPALSAYTSTQPTRRPSLVEPRGDAAARFFPADDTALSSAPAPQLIWVRMRVLNSRAACALAAPTPGTPADALEEESLVCVITPIPCIAGRCWPRAGDVSDSTVGDVGEEHQKGPWVECFEDVAGEARGAVARRGRGAGMARPGILERVAMGVLGSVLKYAVRFGLAGGSSQAGRDAVIGRPIPRGVGDVLFFYSHHHPAILSYFSSSGIMGPNSLSG